MILHPWFPITVSHLPTPPHLTKHQTLPLPFSKPIHPCAALCSMSPHSLWCLGYLLSLRSLAVIPPCPSTPGAAPGVPLQSYLAALRTWTSVIFKPGLFSFTRLSLAVPASLSFRSQWTRHHFRKAIHPITYQATIFYYPNMIYFSSLFVG